MRLREDGRLRVFYAGSLSTIAVAEFGGSVRGFGGNVASPTDPHDDSSLVSCPAQFKLLYPWPSFLQAACVADLVDVKPLPVVR